MRLLILATAFLMIILPQAYSLTASVNSTKLFIDLSLLKDHVSVEKYLLLSNDNDYPVKVLIRADDAITSYMTPIDNNMILGAKEKRPVKIRFDFKKPDNYKGNLKITFKSMNSNEPELDIIVTVIAFIESSQEKPVTNHEGKSGIRSMIAKTALDNDKDKPTDDLSAADIKNGEKMQAGLPSQDSHPDMMVGMIVSVSVIVAGLALFFGLGYIAKHI